MEKKGAALKSTPWRGVGGPWPRDAAGAARHGILSEFVESAPVKNICSPMKWESLYVTGWRGTWAPAFLNASRGFEHAASIEDLF